MRRGTSFARTCTCGERASCTKTIATVGFECPGSFRMGQTHLQRWLPELLDLVLAGRPAPRAAITHRLSQAVLFAG